MNRLRNSSKIFQVHFENGHFLRVDFHSFGMSLTLQGLGQDFNASKGICGNFNGLKDDDQFQMSGNQPDFNLVPAYDRDSICFPQAHQISHMISTSVWEFMPSIEFENVKKSNKSSRYSHGEAFDTCSRALINSSIALACGPYFDRDIMHAMGICTEDVMLTSNKVMAKNTVALIEAQCEAALLRIPEKPFALSISRALNCPNECSGNGQCNEYKGCICNEHIYGHDCSMFKQSLMRIDQEKTGKLCDKSHKSCHQIIAKGYNFDPKGSCNGKYEYINDKEVFCQVEDIKENEVKLIIETSQGNKDSMTIKIFDSRCQICDQDFECKPRQDICHLNGTCHEQNSIHPKDPCLHCVQGQWMAKSDGKMSLAISELNKKFKVVNGDMFEYNLPKMDDETDFNLISGPYGATLSPNGTLSWRAMSNLIADSWTELFIIKAKGLCDEFTLIEVNVHVVSCQCLNGATCVLVQDMPKCICKPGFKGDSCQIMEDPCMVPRCNFGKCIPTDGINFKCQCHPGYTGSLCNEPLHCQCAPGKIF